MIFELSVESPDQKRVIWLPPNEKLLLDDIYLTILLGLKSIYYYDLLGQQQSVFMDQKTKQPLGFDWFVYTHWAYYNFSIVNWCKLFGSYKEPSRYDQLLKTNTILHSLKRMLSIRDKKSFRSGILARSALNYKQFCQYHKNIIAARNKYFIHSEYISNPAAIDGIKGPDLIISEKTFLALFFIINDIAENLPYIKDNVNTETIEIYTIKEVDIFKGIVRRSFPRFEFDDDM